MIDIRERDVNVMARTLYGESRGEDIIGMQAVGHVILNRAKNPGWWSRIWKSDISEGFDESLPEILDDTVEAVCRKPWQFSAWNPGTANRRKMEIVGLQDSHFRNAFYVALAVIQGHLPDPTDGATHFYAYNSMSAPSWVGSATLHCRIGGHAFYTA